MQDPASEGGGTVEEVKTEEPQVEVQDPATEDNTVETVKTEKPKFNEKKVNPLADLKGDPVLPVTTITDGSSEKPESGLTKAIKKFVGGLGKHHKNEGTGTGAVPPQRTTAAANPVAVTPSSAVDFTHVGPSRTGRGRRVSRVAMRSLRRSAARRFLRLIPTLPHSEKPLIVTIGAPGAPPSSTSRSNPPITPMPLIVTLTSGGSRMVCPPMIE